LPTIDRGRFSIIACRPVMDLWLDDCRIKINRENKSTTIHDYSTFYDLLEKFLKDKPKMYAIGYITFEATLPFLGLNPICREARFLFYDSVLIYDHMKNEYRLSNSEYDNYTALFKKNRSLVSTNRIDQWNYEVQPVITRENYFEKINRIKWHIHEGDIYQANFTTCFEVNTDLPPFAAYRQLRQLNPAPYSAYMNFGNYQILSSSPERMFKKEVAHITTSPIKGTIARGENPAEEKANLNRLLNSEKDKAELLMIVDLERNDLGKIAETGSVKVNELYKPEIYSSLIHLVSDIEAVIKPGIGMKDIFRALLPGGSITGAPKKRAVEIITTLESTPRSVYTGCIGYINGERADFNIAIRTMERRDGKYFIHAGGGIVADSEPEAEYEEMLLKAKNLFKALGLENTGIIK